MDRAFVSYHTLARYHSSFASCAKKNKYLYRKVEKWPCNWKKLYVLGFHSGRLPILSCNGKEMPQLQILSVCFASLLLIQAHSLPPRVYLQIEPGKRNDSEPLGCLIFLSAVLFFYYVVARWIKNWSKRSISNHEML